MLSFNSSNSSVSVYTSPKNGVVVGSAAKKNLGRSKKYVVAAVKRIIGLTYTEYKNLQDKSIFGCEVVKGQDGSALMRNPHLAMDLVQAVKEGTNKPVSVKFRLGYTQDEMNFVEFGQQMQEAGAEFITIHGRTRSQFYAGHADWAKIRELKENVDMDYNIVIPSKNIVEFSKILGDDEDTVELHIFNNKILFKNNMGFSGKYSETLLCYIISERIL